MHTEINYTRVFAETSESVKERKALCDFVSWHGLGRSKLFARFARQGGSFRQFDMMACFAGSQGYPNIIAWEHWSGRAVEWGPDDRATN